MSNENIVFETVANHMKMFETFEIFERMFLKVLAKV